MRRARVEFVDGFQCVAHHGKSSVLERVKRAALIEMKRASRAKAVQDPVVKSCSRVPMARMTSASAARVFAEVSR